MVWLATKTLQRINESIAVDGGNAFRRNLGLVMPHLGDAYDDKSDDVRSHLGASVIGNACARAVAFGWRWATKKAPRGRKGEPKVDAHSRMLRLWNRGHLEEGRFIAMLLTAGVGVYQQDANGKQFRISDLGGHYGGSGDGMLYGVPDLPNGVWCLNECKTHSDDSFSKLKKEGVQKSKPEHYIQMQTYLSKFGLLYALYMAVNKNDDELYAEIVQFDGAVDAQFTERAKLIVFGDKLPERMRGASPGFFQCKYMCDHVGVCFGPEKPVISCRSCQHGFAMPDGTWQCAKHTVTLTKAHQIAACGDYKLSEVFK